MKQEITTIIDIPDGYKFKRIDTKWEKGEYFIDSSGLANFCICSFESNYLWVILEKIK
jgi:hypothetical protein